MFLIFSRLFRQRDPEAEGFLNRIAMMMASSMAFQPADQYDDLW